MPSTTWQAKKSGMELVRTHCPEEYYTKRDAIERRLEKDHGAPPEKEYDSSKYRGIKEGDSPKLDLRKAVVLYGKSGKAKTDFALSQGKNPLLVNTWEDLKKIVRSGPNKTDLLVFDECAMLKKGPKGEPMTPALMIYLLDMKKSHTYDTKYHPATIPAFMPHIHHQCLAPR